MEVYTFEDLKTKKLIREVGERMDYIAQAYLDLVVDASEQMFPEGFTDEEWIKFCEDLSIALYTSLDKVCTERGL